MSQSSHAVYQAKLRAVLDFITGEGLSFHKFVVGTLQSNDAEIRKTTTKWIRSHASTDPERYGPSVMLGAIVQAVQTRGYHEQVDSFNRELTALSVPIFEAEFEAASRLAVLHLPHHLNLKQATRQPQQADSYAQPFEADFPRLVNYYGDHMPQLNLLFASLAGEHRAARRVPGEDPPPGSTSRPASASSNLRPASAVPGRKSEEPAEESEEDDKGDRVVPRRQLCILTAMSVLLNARTAQVNRFQMTMGLFFALLRVPALAMQVLNRCGLSTSSRTTHRAMEAVSAYSAEQARQLVRSKTNKLALLFDNLNIYLRHAASRITVSNVSVALTTRTLFSLPSECQPISSAAVEQLRRLDRNKLAISDILDVSDRLREVSIVHVAAALLPFINVDEKQRRLLSDTIRRRAAKLAIGELAPESTTVVPLKVLNVNEGTVDGTKTVLYMTMDELGIGEKEPMSLLAAGDLLTVLNITAAQSALKYEATKREQLANVWPVAGPWHLLLNWVYAMFKTYATAERATSLERFRQMLGRGKTDLQMNKPQFDEGWSLLEHVWTGKLLSALEYELKRDQQRLDSWAPRSKEFWRTLEAVYQGHISAAALADAETAEDKRRATSVLFMRDCVVGWEYHTAIKAGDPPRMAAMEKLLCLAFYGAGQTKYGALMLERVMIDLQLPDVSPSLRAAQLVNVHGGKNGWQGADHLQELFNRRLKMFDVSHATNQAVILYEDRVSAFIGVGQKLVDYIQDSLGLRRVMQHRRKKTFEDDVRLVADDSAVHGVHEARRRDDSTKAEEDHQHGKEKETATQQARRIWAAGARSSGAFNLFDEGYNKLVEGGLQRFRERTMTRTDGGAETPLELSEQKPNSPDRATRRWTGPSSAFWTRQPADAPMTARCQMMKKISNM